MDSVQMLLEMKTLVGLKSPWASWKISVKWKPLIEGLLIGRVIYSDAQPFLRPSSKLSTAPIAALTKASACLTDAFASLDFTEAIAA